MSKASEQATRIGDLERAFRTVAVIALDQRVKPQERLSQILGICRMYDCAPAARQEDGCSH